MFWYSRAQNGKNGYLFTADHKVPIEGCGTQDKRRDFCGTVAIGSGWTMVGGLFRIFCLMGRHHMKGGSENQLTDQLSRLEQWSNITLSLRRTYRNYINLVQKVLPDIFLGYVLYARRIWKGEIMIADSEEFGQMDASELHARRLNAKEVLTPMKGENFIFTVADGTVKISGGDQDLRTSTIRDNKDRGEEQDILRRESEGCSSTSRQD